MNKVALIIVYNHRYDKNIEIIEDIYKYKFSNIYHLMPFYTGKKENVIPVYENSYYFQGYVAQGFKSYFKEEYDHYFFIADDMILNPTINEFNYIENFKLSNNRCYIPGFIKLHELPLDRFWSRTKEAFIYEAKQPGIEALTEIPSYNEALKLFSNFGLKNEYLVFDQIWNRKTLPKKIHRYSDIKKWLEWLRLLFKSNFKRKKYFLRYPLVGSYSDIFIVSSNTIKKFAHYCGVFSATNLHAELAVPTALVLAANEIVTEIDLDKKGKALWPDGWLKLDGDFSQTKGDYDELLQYDFQLKKLLENFPQKYIYLHPIKLSKWNIKI